MNRLLLALPIALVLQGAAAFAGPIAEFEQKFDAMYASYRMALFATNTGDAEKSAKALGAFDMKWAGLAAEYARTPPPQYEDDPRWAQMVAEVGDFLAKAKSETSAGQLPAAHLTLEAVRDAFGELHARNGVETFSDRMNAYHAEMEHVLEMDIDTAGVGTLLERGAVMSYLADDILAAPPAGAAGTPEYDGLAAGFAGSVDAFIAAARSGDMAAIKAAVGGLKKPYSMFFLKFG